MVEEFGFWEGSQWSWRLEWSGKLTGEEQEDAEMLANILLPIQPSVYRDDRWVCLLEKSSNYKVNSAYKTLLLMGAERTIDDSRKNMLQSLWRSKVPSKFAVHAWRLLLDNLPTRMALHQKESFGLVRVIYCNASTVIDRYKEVSLNTSEPFLLSLVVESIGVTTPLQPTI